MQQSMNGEDYIHLASLTDNDWHSICMCSDCGVRPCENECCRCTHKPCATLLHTWHPNGLEAFWPYYAYYRHGEDVLKFYTNEGGPFGIDLGGILTDWIAKQHQLMEVNS